MSLDDEAVTGLDDVFDQWSNMQMTHTDNTRIVEAGARQLEEDFKNYDQFPIDESRDSQKLFGKEIGHLKKGVTHKPGEFADGSTNIGFTSAYEPLARWVNDGTYRQPAQYFMQHFLEEADTDKIFELQAQEAKRVIGEKRV